MIVCRKATLADLPEVAALQLRYHVSSIAPEDRADGFVTTLFSPEQFTELIEREDGLCLALVDSQIVGYAMVGSWEFWSAWPLFQQMIADLPGLSYQGYNLGVDNSYQYGPICIAKEWRGKGVLEQLFAFALQAMAERYPVMLTFINKQNPRSYAAHTRKLGLEVIRTFGFNGNEYYELGILSPKTN